MTRHLLLRLRLAAAGALSLAMVAASAASLPVVLAASGSLYVNSAAANCSDAGNGSSTQPYCSIVKGPQVPTAGTTVLLLAGPTPGPAINPTPARAGGPSPSPPLPALTSTAAP